MKPKKKLKEANKSEKHMEGQQNNKKGEVRKNSKSHISKKVRKTKV